MILSDTAIKRPVFAIVMSMMLVVIGTGAFLRLPVREYPNIDPPIVSITTIYKGASARVIESQITEIVENAVSGIEGIKRIESSSRDERSNVTIEFNLNRAIDGATADIRDKMGRIASRLPEAAETPIIAKVEGDARAMLWISLSSDRRSGLELTDYAQRNIVDRLATVAGVASITMNGERRYAMRVWLDRQALAARRLTVADVETALKAGNIELPAGRIESTQREFTVQADTRLKTVEEFRNLVIRTTEGYQVRLGEVARVELGAADERGESRIDGKTAVSLGVVRQSTANTLAVADDVKAELEVLRPSLPPDIKFTLGYDESLFVAQSIYEVYHSLSVAIGLVIGVIYIFLRSARATLIPAVAIPISIIGSLSAMALFGFSINVLTLLAYVLAIGLVVDDAIVVLENIHRRIEEGEPPLLASIRGARQISFAVIASTLVLVAVFVPISFMQGSTGRLFTEFGVALAAAVLFSGFVALTLSPMLCSKLLLSHEQHGRVYRMTQVVFDGLGTGFRWALDRALRAPLVVLAIAAAVSGIAFELWRVIPKEFAPVEDRGVIVIRVEAPEGSTLAYTKKYILEVEGLVQPLVARGDAQVVFSIVAPGFQRPAPVNQGFVFVRLSPWAERTRTQQALVRELTPKLNAVTGVRATANNPPSLGQRGIQQPVQFVISGAELDSVRSWVDQMLARGSENSRLVNLDQNFRANRPELKVNVDRRKAADLGISVEAIGRTLETLFGSRVVTRYVDQGEEYDVILQARGEDRASPSDLSQLFLRSPRGELVALSNLISVNESASPRDLIRIDRLPAITLQAGLATDYPLGEALTYLDRLAAAELPSEAKIGYSGTSREFKESSSALIVTFGLGLLIVFLVLAAQFESFRHPFIIMLAVPLAVTGGLAGLVLWDYSLNVYSQIGMIMLIGLMAKNGILVVEFANQLRVQGMEIREAVIEASVVRLRPILMTTISTIFGAVPLLMGHGAGIEARSALGIVVVSGMALSSLMTLFVVPALYILIARGSKTIDAVAVEAERLEAEEQAQQAEKPRRLAAE
jgi:multidrug efflux pump